MNIIAIGGGDRTPAVRRGLELAGEPNRVLLIPSAASIEMGFNRKVANATRFFNSLGIETDLLHEFGETPTRTRLEHEIGRASIIYTIGGNTPYLIKTLQAHGSDILLKRAIERGDVVHTGTSAGALLPFRIAHSNISPRPAEEEWDFEYLRPPIDIINAVATAHANQHDPTPEGPRPDTRLEVLMSTFPSDIERGYAIDNGAAAIFGDNPGIIHANPDSNVHYVSRFKDGTVVSRIAETKDIRV